MDIDKLLDGVQKPGRYIGGEYNSIKKPWEKTPIKICLAYPDIYEIGMSYLGIKILYHLLNKEEDILCERVFAPWVDMEQNLKKHKTPLFSLESRKPLRDFDILGFSINYELTYTNVLNMLDLAGIPIFSKQRTEKDPIIIAGGTSSFNPVPLKEFIDIFFIGESEEKIKEFIDVFKTLKSKKIMRNEILSEFKNMEGLYIPRFHKGEKIKKIIVKNFSDCFYPEKEIVPFIRIVHDRIAMEIMRGCPNKCRFCQAKVLYNPVRIRSEERIMDLAKTLLNNTGYEEISFLSLSSANYPHIVNLLSRFAQEVKDRGINVSIPSLRIEDMLHNIPKLILQNRKTGLTFAPEAGSEYLRNSICKQIDIENLFDTARESFEHGWSRIKLYFMIGLPGESKKDLEGIKDIAYKLLKLKESVSGKKLLITLSINSFIPKPHTPFQWLGMDKKELLLEKQHFLAALITDRRIKLDFQDVNISILEAALSRGDERMNDIICDAWKNGARFDSWKDIFDINAWERASTSHGLSLEEMSAKKFGFDEFLPWDFIDTGIIKAYLIEEAKKANS